MVTASRTYISWDHETLPLYIVNAQLGGDRFDCRIVQFRKVLQDPTPEPDGPGKSELPIFTMWWNGSLSPLSDIPAGGWSEAALRVNRTGDPAKAWSPSGWRDTWNRKDACAQFNETGEST